MVKCYEENKRDNKNQTLIGEDLLQASGQGKRVLGGNEKEGTCCGRSGEKILQAKGTTSPKALGQN